MSTSYRNLSPVFERGVILGLHTELADLLGWIVFLFFFYCSVAVFNASPSAHDQSAAALRSQASGCLLCVISGGAASRSASPTGGRKSSGWEPRKQPSEFIWRGIKATLVGKLSLAGFARWVECNERQSLRFPPNNTEWKSWSKLPEWIYCRNTVKSPKMNGRKCGLNWKPKERTDWHHKATVHQARYPCRSTIFKFGWWWIQVEERGRNL